MVELDLAIDVTHIGEAEPGDPRPTRWYRLEHPVHIPIGDRIEIPVPLRRLVTPPVLYDHTWTPAPLAGTETQRFKDGPLYDYAVIADWVKVAQDVIYLKVDYGDAEAVRAAASEPLVRSLIEFHHSYGSVMKQLARIGVDEPDHAMRLAIEVFIRAAQKVANAFQVTRGGFRARAAVAGSEEYKIHVDTDQIDHIKGGGHPDGETSDAGRGRAAAGASERTGAD